MNAVPCIACLRSVHRSKTGGAMGAVSGFSHRITPVRNYLELDQMDVLSSVCGANKCSEHFKLCQVFLPCDPKT